MNANDVASQINGYVPGMEKRAVPEVSDVDLEKIAEGVSEGLEKLSPNLVERARWKADDARRKLLDSVDWFPMHGKMDQVMINGRLVSDSGREMKTLKERLNRIGRQEHKFRQYLQNAEDMGKSLSVEDIVEDYKVEKAGGFGRISDIGHGIKGGFREKSIRGLYGQLKRLRPGSPEHQAVMRELTRKKRKIMGVRPNLFTKACGYKKKKPMKKMGAHMPRKGMTSTGISKVSQALVTRARDKAYTSWKSNKKSLGRARGDRFGGLPGGVVDDWMRYNSKLARQFRLFNTRLQSMQRGNRLAKVSTGLLRRAQGKASDKLVGLGGTPAIRQAQDRKWEGKLTGKDKDILRRWRQFNNFKAGANYQDAMARWLKQEGQMGAKGVRRTGRQFGQKISGRQSRKINAFLNPMPTRPRIQKSDLLKFTPFANAFYRARDKYRNKLTHPSGSRHRKGLAQDRVEMMEAGYRAGMPKQVGEYFESRGPKSGGIFANHRWRLKSGRGRGLATMSRLDPKTGMWIGKRLPRYLRTRDIGSLDERTGMRHAYMLGRIDANRFGRVAAWNQGRGAKHAIDSARRKGMYGRTMSRRQVGMHSFQRGNSLASRTRHSRDMNSVRALRMKGEKDRAWDYLRRARTHRKYGEARMGDIRAGNFEGMRPMLRKAASRSYMDVHHDSVIGAIRDPKKRKRKNGMMKRGPIGRLNRQKKRAVMGSPMMGGLFTGVDAMRLRRKGRGTADLPNTRQGADHVSMAIQRMGEIRRLMAQDMVPASRRKGREAWDKVRGQLPQLKANILTNPRLGKRLPSYLRTDAGFDVGMGNPYMRERLRANMQGNWAASDKSRIWTDAISRRRTKGSGAVAMKEGMKHRKTSRRILELLSRQRGRSLSKRLPRGFSRAAVDAQVKDIRGEGLTPSEKYLVTRGEAHRQGRHVYRGYSGNRPRTIRLGQKMKRKSIAARERRILPDMHSRRLNWLEASTRFAIDGLNSTDDMTRALARDDINLARSSMKLIATERKLRMQRRRLP